MNQVMDGLYATEPEPLSFAPRLLIRAYLLRREQGNVLLYSSNSVAEEADAIEGLGGIARRYLNHWHESSFGCAATTARFEAPLLVHAADRDSVASRCEVDESFAARAMVESDLEAIPIPGHTPGATAFLWDSGAQRFLFTGDSLLLDGGDWVGAVLDSSDRVAYIESLELIRALDFDVLVPWAASAEGPIDVMNDHAEVEDRIDAVLERVRAGKNH